MSQIKTPQKPKIKPVLVRVPDTIIQIIDAIIREQGYQSRSEFIRQAIRNEIMKAKVRE